MIQELKRIVPKLALILPAVASAGAQSNGTGLLAGEITDASGAVIRSAAVAITNEATLQRWESHTNALGLYRAPLLPPGLYTLEVRSAGFVPLQYSHIAVDTASSKVLSVRLTAGSQQTVEVGAPPAALDTAANFGSVTDRAMVADLPLAARNYTQILGLNAGVASEVADAGALGARFDKLFSGPGRVFVRTAPARTITTSRWMAPMSTTSRVAACILAACRFQILTLLKSSEYRHSRTTLPRAGTPAPTSTW